MIRSRMTAGLAALALMTGTAMAAEAQTASQPVAATAPVMSRITWSGAKPTMDLADPRLSLATPYAARGGPVSTGNKTAIDHRFADRDAVGSIGYLCGLKPGPNEAGGVASAYDAAGTFLGGQLKVAW